MEQRLGQPQEADNIRAISEGLKASGIEQAAVDELLEHFTEFSSYAINQYPNVSGGKFLVWTDSDELEHKHITFLLYPQNPDSVTDEQITTLYGNFEPHVAFPSLPSVSAHLAIAEHSGWDPERLAKWLRLDNPTFLGQIPLTKPG